MPLAHALVARLAELEDVRILFVKGPTADAQGARPPRPSSDVDVLCEPGSMERLGDALEAAGWRRRAVVSVMRLEHAAKYLFDHSAHYIHSEWPCDIDVHFNFPGFLAPADVVFETLWKRRSIIHVAGMPVVCADILGQAMIVGLHALRDPDDTLSQADLEHLTHMLKQMSPTRLAEISCLAADTGCSETLSPLLEHSGARVLGSPWRDSDGLRRWHVRTESKGIYTTSWLIEMRHTPWWRTPPLIWHALFLPREELLNQHTGTTPLGWRGVVRLQATRWWRALRRLPRSIRAARQIEGDFL